MKKHTPTKMYTLRAKLGGEIHTALEALQNGETLTDEQLKDLTGLSRTPWLIRQLPKWFDNIGVTSPYGEAALSATYAEVMPAQVGIVTSDVTFNAGKPELMTPGNEPSFEKVLKWPLAPPIIEEMQYFEEPSWFNRMEMMVMAGSHISLESPAGIGKDTAVQQLAAKHRKPLVTIPGDAGFRRRDLVGSPDVTNGTSYLNVAEYAAAAVNGWWVLITEVNAAEADALMYINSQLAAPYVVTIEGNAYPVHKDFRLFISYNAGFIGTKPLPQSFKDRFFSIKVPFFTEYALSRRLIKMSENNMPELLAKYIAAVGSAVYKDFENGRIRYQVTVRRLFDVYKLFSISGCSFQDALIDVLCDAVDVKIESSTIKATIQRVLQDVSSEAVLAKEMTYADKFMNSED